MPALAGATAAFVALVAGTALAQAPVTERGEPRADGVAALRAPFNEAAATPRAAPGSELAARRAISRSQLRQALAAEMRRAGGASGAWVADFRAQGNRVLYSHSAKQRRMLASNTKLFTTAAYVNRFGAKGRLATKVWVRGKRRGPKQRILDGKIFLVGDGDPALSSSRFASGHGLPHTGLAPLARAVKRAGIERVNGTIVADETIFDAKRSVPQAGITGSYLTRLSGLSYESGQPSNPARAAGKRFKRALAKHGVRVKGQVKLGRAPAKLKRREPLGEALSPRPLALMAETNKPSNNFYAEMLLKRLGVKQGKRATTKRGAARAQRFARKVGSGVRMENGSGLSRRNVASPREVGKLLIALAKRKKLWATFRDSLAIAGRDGTLQLRMRGTAAEGRCFGKTGTINGVSTLSGYCRAGKGGLVAFSILMNSVNTDAARRAQDAMVAAIARYG